MEVPFIAIILLFVLLYRLGKAVQKQQTVKAEGPATSRKVQQASIIPPYSETVTATKQAYNEAKAEGEANREKFRVERDARRVKEAEDGRVAKEGQPTNPWAAFKKGYKEAKSD